MELPAPVQLLLALSDLKAVRAVTDAFNAGLPKTGPLGTIPAGAKPFYILDRRPTPSVGVAIQGPRDNYVSGGVAAPVSYETYRPISGYFPFDGPVAGTGPVCRNVPLYATDPCVGSDVDRSYSVPRSRSPIQPPWRVLPWEQPAEIRIEVKHVAIKSDFISKGTLIDLFV